MDSQHTFPESSLRLRSIEAVDGNMLFLWWPGMEVPRASPGIGHVGILAAAASLRAAGSRSGVSLRRLATKMVRSASAPSKLRY